MFLFVSVILGACSVGAFYQRALGASSSVQALGHRAWLRISGTGEPSERMTRLRAIRARARAGEAARDREGIYRLRKGRAHYPVRYRRGPEGVGPDG